MRGTARHESASDSEGWTALRLALQWLRHPVSLISIAVLIVNDHVLKAQFGSWWTGKLSDFAGLIFFPALLAAALAAVGPRASFRRVALTSLVATGVVFTWVKATAIGSETASAAWSALAGPSVILRDSTDLVALPMLGLAALVAFRQRLRRDVVVATIVVPVAVFATVATGAPPDPSAYVLGEDPNGTFLVIERAESYGDSAAYELEPDGSWRHISIFDADFPDPLPANQTLACDPSDAAVCFRPLADAIGVEISSDGGSTWTTDWALSAEQMAQLVDAYDILDDDVPELATHGLALVPADAGFRVIAANGPDGLAVRDENGQWSREGWAGLRCCDYVHTVDLSEPDQEWRSQESLPWPLVSGLLVFVLAFAVFLFASPRARVRHPGWVVLGVVMFVVGMGWAALSLGVNGMPSGRVPDGGFGAILIVGNLVMGLVPAFAAVFVIEAAPAKVYGIGLAWAAIVATVVALAVGLASGAAVPTAVVAVVALAVALTAVMWVERARHRKSDPVPAATQGSPAS